MIEFERIYERDIDLLVMQLFLSNHPACEAFYKQTAFEKLSIVKVKHSAKSLHGESDVEIWFEDSRKKYAFLIEDKINASAQPCQFSRYVRRGDDYISNEKLAGYQVFLVAPEAYLSSNEEASKYPAKISFEDLISYMDQQKDAFFCEILRNGISKFKESKIVDEAATSFWKEYRNLCNDLKKEGYDLTLNDRTETRSVTSVWYTFSTRVEDTIIVHKTEKGYMDLQFNGKADKQREMLEILNRLGVENASVEVTGKSLSIRKDCKKLNALQPFEEQKAAVREALEAAAELNDLADKIKLERSLFSTKR